MFPNDRKQYKEQIFKIYMAIPQTILTQTRKDLYPSLKKYTKRDWIAHAKSLQNIPKKEIDIKKLLEMAEELIPITKNLQDSVLKSTNHNINIWNILNEELIILNHIYRYLEEDIQLSKRILNGFIELTKWANLEEDLVKESI